MSKWETKEIRLEQEILKQALEIAELREENEKLKAALERRGEIIFGREGD